MPLVNHTTLIYNWKQTSHWLCLNTKKATNITKGRKDLGSVKSYYYYFYFFLWSVTKSVSKDFYNVTNVLGFKLILYF